MENVAVDILLATYNGAVYLPEQLRSLEAQSHAAWRLIARDDGSSDDSRKILEAFRAKHPAQVKVLADVDGRLGTRGNFRRLMAESTAGYVFFCDQDDSWLPDKVARLLGTMVARERPGEPLLVHSDLAVVDRNLRPLSPSLWAFQAIDPSRSGYRQLAVQNVVTGCACVVNGALREAAMPIPEEAIMHDWWFALVAAATGRIVAVPEATVRYRQHGGNDTGAKEWGMVFLWRNLGGLLTSRRFSRKVEAYQRQAAALVRLNPKGMAPEVGADLAEFARLKARSFPARVRFVCRRGFLQRGLIRNAVFFWNL